MEIRSANTKDAIGMSHVLAQIIAMWGSDRPSDPAHMRALYIEDPSIIQCAVAIDNARDLLGFQVLKLAAKGNIYGTRPGWGIIGTYVRLDAGRRGIGSALFAATRHAAQQEGLGKIDATIGEGNEPGLKYYGAMGFETYSTKPGSICKCYGVPERANAHT